ncbi:hypothetical protein SNOG_11465 [Parastagonospora nodorum SN15]|uniref:Uncharacterized protein n=1 Tax=Phaeosphaeria nodorum (strain SN15 / ATCC MYA-4574 / FGSC 10173) TaxID=321614 RepID=Q0U9U9_PHANO|nr:hypothetical protein SNOG_11465 [Parastagonospora nodorum SN15]EAT81173.1 hypothetical protein SNOG_11465 [Parastagonospora nodorum SN15]
MMLTRGRSNAIREAPEAAKIKTSFVMRQVLREDQYRWGGWQSFGGQRGRGF